MEHQISERHEILRWVAYMIDALFLCIYYWIAGRHIYHGTQDMQDILTLVMSYLLSVSIFVPVAQNRMVRVEEVIRRALITALAMAAVVAVCESVLLQMPFNFRAFFVNCGLLYVALALSRITCRNIVKSLRSRHQDQRKVVFVGGGVNLRALYDRMSSDLSTGYTINGYFEDKPSRNIGGKLPLLGSVAEVIAYLEAHHVDMLFCNLSDQRAEDITKIMDYCENHLIHFYSLPNVRNYVHRAMTVAYVDDIPVLSVRREPLRDPMNKFIKRLFDLVFSGLFLITCFWWIYIIVAIITKITMPGPVFFRQKRNGRLGEEFYCIKFRSMKVNADADKGQATKNDPRKTKWGNIMRKTNIDELPQFLNVFMGSMSVVGPRPHMVKHTEEYGALVNKYMVRHFAKPGITGWAQVTGSRGETSELWMMEERIKKDIWYIEHWSLLLDIKIIFKTITNVFGGEKGNAY